MKNNSLDEYVKGKSTRHFQKEYINNIQEKAIETFGDEHQLLILIEEMAELQKEVVKHVRYNNNYMQIVEEMTDVYMMLEQTQKILSISKEEIELIKFHKALRLEERMKGLLEEND